MTLCSSASPGYSSSSFSPSCSSWALGGFANGSAVIIWSLLAPLGALAMWAGVIGRAKFQDDVWGDTVNTASRMESHGLPGRIQLSPTTYDLVQQDFVCERRGVVEVKGKGPMETWFPVGAR